MDPLATNLLPACSTPSHRASAQWTFVQRSCWCWPYPLASLQGLSVFLPWLLCAFTSSGLHFGLLSLRHQEPHCQELKEPGIFYLLDPSLASDAAPVLKGDKLWGVHHTPKCLLPLEAPQDSSWNHPPHPTRLLLPFFCCLCSLAHFSCIFSLIHNPWLTICF